MTLLWSIVPTDAVFATESDAPSKLREIHVGGATMLVEPSENGYARIERVISGNPQHYLKPEWQPGQHIQFPLSQ